MLRTPIPKVLAWSSKAEGSHVGAEYIIMEKVAGIELERVWPNMSIKDKFAIVKAIAGFQKAWTSVSFKKFGSFYYAKDLDQPPQDKPLYVEESGKEVVDLRFAVGPCMGREYVDDGRMSVDFDRGPCRARLSLEVSITHR